MSLFDKWKKSNSESTKKPATQLSSDNILVVDWPSDLDHLEAEWTEIPVKIKGKLFYYKEKGFVLKMNAGRRDGDAEIKVKALNRAENDALLSLAKNDIFSEDVSLYGRLICKGRWDSELENAFRYFNSQYAVYIACDPIASSKKMTWAGLVKASEKRFAKDNVSKNCNSMLEAAVSFLLDIYSDPCPADVLIKQIPSFLTDNLNIIASKWLNHIQTEQFAYDSEIHKIANLFACCGITFIPLSSWDKDDFAKDKLFWGTYDLNNFYSVMSNGLFGAEYLPEIDRIPETDWDQDSASYRNIKKSIIFNCLLDNASGKQGIEICKSAIANDAQPIEFYKAWFLYGAVIGIYYKLEKRRFDVIGEFDIKNTKTYYQQALFNEEKQSNEEREIDVKSTELFNRAIELLKSDSVENKKQGRRMIINEACRDSFTDKAKDPRVFHWMAREYEYHGCRKSAAFWYKQAFERGISRAGELADLYDNPYDIDPFYDIYEEREEGNGYKVRVKVAKKRFADLYDETRKKLEQATSFEERQRYLNIIDLLASARICSAPNANTFMGDLVSEEDPESATSLYKYAADNGDAEGARKYANALSVGKGVKKDAEKAIYYLEIAAQRGDVLSQYRCGLHYEEKGNTDKAKLYYRIAAKNGNEQAKQRLAELDAPKSDSTRDQRDSLEDAINKNDKEAVQKTVQEFYADCIEDYHNTAKKQGMANRGLIFIPELIPIGEKTVLAFLRDPFFQSQFGSNPQMYYYVIMSLSIQAGIVFAVKWHENYPALKAGYVDQIIDEGPADACKPYLRQLGLSNNEKENAFYQVIFERWLAKHEPYWRLSDPRAYTFKATLAAYQLGISMILEKYGY